MTELPVDAVDSCDVLAPAVVAVEAAAAGEESNPGDPVARGPKPAAASEERQCVPEAAAVEAEAAPEMDRQRGAIEGTE